jgi:hypothetical protein
MTLNPSVLGEKLYNTITETSSNELKQLWLNIATEILSHIQKNGEINVVVQTTTGSGTGTGKIS